MTMTTASLGAAANHLDAAIAELKAFGDQYPKRLDAQISDALDMASTARDKINTDYYTENEAAPGYND